MVWTRVGSSGYGKRWTERFFNVLSQKDLVIPFRETSSNLSSCTDGLVGHWSKEMLEE